MTTPIVGAPEWAAAQASPWVAHNVALRLLESGHGIALIADRDLTEPPESCADGALYLVGAEASGLWEGHDGALAIAVGANAANGWQFVTVERKGFILHVQDEGAFLYWNGTAWAALEMGSGGDLALDDLTDVDAPEPSEGDVLTFDGLDWVPQAPADAGIEDAPEDGQTYGRKDGDWAEIVIPSAPPFTVGCFFTTKPTSSEVLLRYSFAENVTFADEWSGSAGKIGTNPTSSFVLTVKKNGSSVGTITVSTGGVFTFATTGTTVSFASGDELTIEGPATADATAANCSFTLKGARA